MHINKPIQRPWGSYTILNQGNGYKIKIVEVTPFKRLSLQKHKHRSEHWVVLEGEARITNKSSVCVIKEQESAFIPKDGIHRLENPVNKPLRIIEVQCGNYVEEDDIERLEDDFQRR